MPTLDNPRHEAFAAACADGELPADAYEDAGYAPDHGNASRMVLRPDIAARIAELRAGRTDASLTAALAALLRLAKDPDMLANPAAMKEARQTLMEAHRLQASVVSRRHIDRRKARFYNEIIDPAADTAVVNS